DAPERFDSAIALAGCDQFHNGSHCRCLRPLVPWVVHAVSLLRQTEDEECVDLRGVEVVIQHQGLHCMRENACQDDQTYHATTEHSPHTVFPPHCAVLSYSS